MDPQSQEPRRGFSPHIIYLGIIALLLAAGVYLFTTKSKTEDELVLKDEQLLTMGNDKEIIETEYNDALRRLDEMKTESQQMDSLLTTKDGEISEMRNKIEKLLKQKKLSASELAEANSLITELKSKMNGYQQQIIALKQENVELTEDNKALTEDKTLLTKEREKLTEEKKGLEKTVELGSVLRASSIRLEAINERKNLLGKEKEKETDKAKRADLIRISFDVDDNRISESGEKMLYICVYDPSGKVIAGNSSNRFKMADDSEMSYTASKSIPYKQGEKVKGISTEWKPLSRFDKGNYKVEIYHMGHKIGSEMVSLR
jgi:myosin heavy subunit